MTGFIFPNESNAYRAARDRLLAQEVELRRTTEAVAAARRALPPGGEVPQEYVFASSPRQKTASTATTGARATRVTNSPC